MKIDGKVDMPKSNVEHRIVFPINKTTIKLQQKINKTKKRENKCIAIKKWEWIPPPVLFHNCNLCGTKELQIATVGVNIC